MYGYRATGTAQTGLRGTGGPIKNPGLYGFPAIIMTMVYGLRDTAKHYREKIPRDLKSFSGLQFMY